MRPSFWWDAVTIRPGGLNPTAWIQVCSTADSGASTHMAGTGHGPGMIAVGHGSLWVANRGSRTVVRLEPSTLELGAIQKFSKAPAAITACPDAVWTVGSNGWLWRQLSTSQQTEGVARVGRAATAIAVTEGMVWVLRRNGRLYGLDPASGETVTEGKVPRGAHHMVAHNGTLWVSCGHDRRLVCFEPGMRRVSGEIRLPQRVKCLALIEDELLVGCARSLSLKHGWLHRIDCSGQRIVSTTELTGQPRAIAGKDGTGWVAWGSGPFREGIIGRVDLGSGEVTEWRGTNWKVSDLALVDEELLASMHLELAVPVSDGSG